LYIIERIKRVDVFYNRIGLTIGNFEGLHRGHFQILKSLVSQSKKSELRPAVITFKEHPLKIVRNIEPEKLTVPSEKLIELKNEGIDLLIYLDFSRELADTQPLAFMDLLKRELSPRLLCLGSSFRFGRGNTGTIDFLYKNADKYGYEMLVVNDVIHNGVPISSTRIRDAVKNGQFNLVHELLGRYYQIYVIVGSENPYILKSFIQNCAIPEKGNFSVDLFGEGGVRVEDVRIERIEDGFRALYNGRLKLGALYKLRFNDRGKNDFDI
jgi:riboflavin kinase/FMN adenylyltransferase